MARWRGSAGVAAAVGLCALALVLAAAPRATASCVQAEWTSVPAIPTGLGEVSTGIVKDARGNPLLIVVGQGSNVTFQFQTWIYNLTSNTWFQGARRNFTGHHQASVVYNNEFYLIGGFQYGASGRMQVYNPVTNSWRVPPWAGLHSSGSGTAVIFRNRLWYCGGIVNGTQNGGAPMTNCSVFNFTTQSWSAGASLVFPVHHAAMGTDGKKIYVFGGRDTPGNTVTTGSNYVQVYDPATNVWTSHASAGGPSVLPEGRGGLGASAVYMNGRFLLIGGETDRCKNITCPNTTLGLLSGGVYDRIDAYDPEDNTWTRVYRTGSTTAGMDVARHGIFPFLFYAAPGEPGTGNAPGIRVYVCGGGTRNGFSVSTICSYFTLGF